MRKGRRRKGDEDGRLAVAIAALVESYHHVQDPLS